MLAVVESHRSSFCARCALGRVVAKLNSMSAFGTCTLCHRDSALQVSHLIPRALYLDLRTPELPNPNPIVGTPEETGPRQEQVAAPLLCSGCEHLFNTRGEKWVLENGYRMKGP